MIEQQVRQQRALNALTDAVNNGVAYLGQVEADFNDGYQTAHEVLAHLVFWHCEHCAVARALLAGETPDLKNGTLTVLNAQACEAAAGSSMDELTGQLTALQTELADLLKSLPDWEAPFPLKEEGLTSTVEDRVFALAAHIDKHVAMFRRVEARAEPQRDL